VQWVVVPKIHFKGCKEKKGSADSQTEALLNTFAQVGSWTVASLLEILKDFLGKARAIRAIWGLFA